MIGSANHHLLFSDGFRCTKHVSPDSKYGILYICTLYILLMIRLPVPGSQPQPRHGPEILTYDTRVVKASRFFFLVQIYSWSNSSILPLPWLHIKPLQEIDYILTSNLHLTKPPPFPPQIQTAANPCLAHANKPPLRASSRTNDPHT